MSGRGEDRETGRVEREAEARRILAAMADATPEARLRLRDELVAGHLDLVHGLARKYRGRGEPLDDLVQAGSIGLLSAIERFDPDRGSAFDSYAIACILGSIRQHFREGTWSIKVSRQLKERIRAIDRLMEEGVRDTGRAPTARELATTLDVSVEDVLEAMEAARIRSMIPLDEPAIDGASPADGLGMLDPALELIPDRQAVIEGLRTMPDLERQALLLTTVEGLSQAEAGARLGVSQMQVHRLKARAQARLRAASEPDERQP